MKFKTAAALVATPIVTLGSGFLIANSTSEFIQEKEEVLPYVQLAGTQSMGSQWLDGFLATQPFSGADTGNSQNWKQVSTVRTLITDENIKCVEPQPMPAYILDAKTASNDTVTISAVTTHAGMSKSIIDSYESRASDCSIELERNEDNSRVDISDTTSLLFHGDTIVSVSFPRGFSGDKERIVNEVSGNIVDSLETFRCNSITTNVEDRKRNIYYTINNDPVGKFQTDTIKTEEDVVNLPTLIDVAPGVLNYPNLVKPEAPYPENFPDVPRSQVEKPDIPPFPTVTTDTFEKDVTFEVPDFEGAGCGWDWSSGQETPVYNIEFLEQNKENKRKETLDEVNASASRYISNYLGAVGSRAIVQPQVIKWNRYVDKVNSTHNRWIELDNARAAMKPDYDSYLQAWRDWATFDERKEAYQDFYDRKVEFCEKRDDDFLEWQKDMEEINNNNRDDDSRDRDDESDETQELRPAPAVCGDIARPEILNQERGAEPEFVATDNVTVPNSWEKTEDVNQDAIVRELESSLDAEYDAIVGSLAEEDRRILEEWEEAQREAERERERPTPSDSNTPNEPSIVDRIESGDFDSNVPDINDLADLLP